MLGEFWYNGMEALYHVRVVLVQWYVGLCHVRGVLLQWYGGLYHVWGDLE